MRIKRWHSVEYSSKAGNAIALLVCLDNLFLVLLFLVIAGKMKFRVKPSSLAKQIALGVVYTLLFIYALTVYYQSTNVSSIHIQCDIRALTLEYHVANMPFVDRCSKRKTDRGSLFNDMEKAEILANVVANFLRARGEYGNQKEWKKANQAGKTGKGRITTVASNNTASLNGIRSVYCPTVSKTSVWRAQKANRKSIHQAGKNEEVSDSSSRSQESQDGFYPCTHAMDFGMTESILAFSLHFIQIIYSDEKKFSLDGADTFTSYWRDLTKERRSFSTRNFGCGSLMEWAAFSSFGALELVLISTKTNSVGYKQVLENHLLPYYNRFPQKNFIFQQDNAAIHVSCSTKDWFRRRNIVLTDWPSRSPDRNPSENLWGILASQVYAHNRQLSSIEGLKKTDHSNFLKTARKCIMSKVDMGGDYEKDHFNIEGFANTDELKYHILPLPGAFGATNDCTVISLGIGKDVEAEKSMQAAMPNCQFWGADPVNETNADIFPEVGKFYNIAVGAENGTFRSYILEDIYRYQEVKYIDITTFLRTYVKRKIIDQIMIDIEHAEYPMLPYLLENGQLTQEGYTICQMNIEIHRPNKVQLEQFFSFYEKIMQEDQWTFMSASSIIGHLSLIRMFKENSRLYMINHGNAECHRRYIGETYDKDE
uniref:DDE_3 domain-containing protein n=1 Tax=Heterorhabditis bacteriophora TaxID=37862 RepID=A0A1I7X7R0_HETBA